MSNNLDYYKYLNNLSALPQLNIQDILRKKKYPSTGSHALNLKDLAFLIETAAHRYDVYTTDAGLDPDSYNRSFDGDFTYRTSFSKNKYNNELIATMNTLTAVNWNNLWIDHTLEIEDYSTDSYDEFIKRDTARKFIREEYGSYILDFSGDLSTAAQKISENKAVTYVQDHISASYDALAKMRRLIYNGCRYQISYTQQNTGDEDQDYPYDSWYTMSENWYYIQHGSSWKKKYTDAGSMYFEDNTGTDQMKDIGIRFKIKDRYEQIGSIKCFLFTEVYFKHDFPVNISASQQEYDNEWMDDWSHIDDDINIALRWDISSDIVRKYEIT